MKAVLQGLLGGVSCRVSTALQWGVVGPVGGLACLAGLAVFARKSGDLLGGLGACAVGMKPLGMDASCSDQSPWHELGSSAYLSNLSPSAFCLAEHRQQHHGSICQHDCEAHRSVLWAHASQHCRHQLAKTCACDSQSMCSWHGSSNPVQLLLKHWPLRHVDQVCLHQRPCARHHFQKGWKLEYSHESIALKQSGCRAAGCWGAVGSRLCER